MFKVVSLGEIFQIQHTSKLSEELLSREYEFVEYSLCVFRSFLRLSVTLLSSIVSASGGDFCSLRECWAACVRPQA